MSLVIFTKTAAGPTLGPYTPGDVVDLSAGDITKLVAAQAVVTDTTPGDVATDQSGTL